ncbi:MAG: NADH-quinone oxidoreductase subunit L [Phycisphaerae bacterium]
MNTSVNLLIVATLLPLLGFLVLIFVGPYLKRASSYVGTAMILTSFVLSLAALVVWLGSAETRGEHHTEVLNYTWLDLPDAAPGTHVAVNPQAPEEAKGVVVGALVDSLTLTMFVMITLIASLVHVFSIGYMRDDPRFSRFFAYLGLFCFSMLGLVISNSLLQMFIFWELVGVCSYLLIGFWFEKRGPAMASKKAMIANRIGDAGFLVGMGILICQIGFGGLTLFDASNNPVLTDRVLAAIAGDSHGITDPATRILQHVGGPNAFLGLSWLSWAGICLFVGAIAKSAQFPLHVWLPDAMEGPTPVSALIHAATMVAAGVFLVARIYPILTADARLFISIIGCTTLLMAAMIAMVMTDIKKILAYSTISQLGFMILFLGTGGYVAGLFHLITHAFFKACLFLGSGSVIHACHHEQEVTRMGGLVRKLPVTALTFGISVLAIAGTPFFSGFYSKELGLAGVEMYAHALGGKGMWLYYVPTFTAYLTAFYMWRCWWLTFGGKPREQHVYDHAHESPIMTLPLIVLGVLALVAGYSFMGIEKLIHDSAPAAAYLIPAHEESLADAFAHNPVIWAFILGPVLAIGIYFNGLGVASRIARLPVINLIHFWLKEKMFFDWAYDGIVVGGTKLFAMLMGWWDNWVIDGLVNGVGLTTKGLCFISGNFDRVFVDGAVNGAADLAHATGDILRTSQTGRIRTYVLTVFTVLACTIVGVVILMRLPETMKAVFGL